MMNLKNLFFTVIILVFLVGLSQAGGNRVGNKAGDKVSLSNKVYSDRTEALLLKTGQIITYRPVALDDDGALELGIAHSYTVLTTGQYAGNVTVTINSKNYDFPNACVKDNKTGLMWARTIPQTDIGPANDGQLFWDQWTLSAETCTCNATNKTITADAGAPFDTGALCAGRIFTILGSAAGNNGTFTVAGISTSVITVSETVVDEASIALDFATVDDLIWDLKDQANSGSGIAGYTDWRIPNWRELASLLNIGVANPYIDHTAFPSTPTNSYWTGSTSPYYNNRSQFVDFGRMSIGYVVKDATKYYVRLVRN